MVGNNSYETVIIIIPNYIQSSHGIYSSGRYESILGCTLVLISIVDGTYLWWFYAVLWPLNSIHLVIILRNFYVA